MKTRLNLVEENIGYHFGVHQTTVSRNFHMVLDVMDVHLIKWHRRSYTLAYKINFITASYLCVTRKQQCSKPPTASVYLDNYCNHSSIYGKREKTIISMFNYTYFGHMRLYVHNVQYKHGKENKNRPKHNIQNKHINTNKDITKL